MVKRFYLFVVMIIGVYLIILDIAHTVEPNEYDIDIYVTGQPGTLGSIQFNVEKHDIVQTEETSPLDLAISVGGFAIFVLLAAVILGLMYRVNKSP